MYSSTHELYSLYRDDGSVFLVDGCDLSTLSSCYDMESLWRAGLCDCSRRGGAVVVERSEESGYYGVEGWKPSGRPTGSL